MRRAASILAALVGVLLLPTGAGAAEPAPWAMSSHARTFVVRLRPDADLLASLRGFAKEHGLRAAFVASCAGSASRTSVRYANQPVASVREGHFEIVSLSGTLAEDGAHLHVAFADSTGAAFGGHLMEGTTIYTTAEIVLGELTDVAYTREPDPTFGYRELVPRPRSGKPAGVSR